MDPVQCLNQIRSNSGQVTTNRFQCGIWGLRKELNQQTPKDENFGLIPKIEGTTVATSISHCGIVDRTKILGSQEMGNCEKPVRLGARYRQLSSELRGT